MRLRGSNAFFFLQVSFFDGRDFPLISVKGFGKGGAFNLLSGNNDASVHPGFDLSGPGLGRGLRVKSPGDSVESLSFDDCPPGSASFPEI